MRLSDGQLREVAVSLSEYDMHTLEELATLIGATILHRTGFPSVYIHVDMVGAPHTLFVTQPRIQAAVIACMNENTEGRVDA